MAEIAQRAAHGERPLEQVATQDMERLDEFRAVDDEASRRVDVERDVVRIVSEAAEKGDIDGAWDALETYHDDVVADEGTDPRIRERLGRYCRYQARRVMALNRQRSIAREREDRVERLGTDLRFYVEAVEQGEMAVETAEAGLRERLDAARPWLRSGEAERISASFQQQLTVSRLRHGIVASSGAVEDEQALASLPEAEAAELRALAQRLSFDALVHHVVALVEQDATGADGEVDYDAALEALEPSSALRAQGVDDTCAQRAASRVRSRRAAAERVALAQREAARVAAIEQMMTAYEQGDCATAFAAVDDARGVFGEEEYTTLLDVLEEEQWTTYPGSMVRGVLLCLRGEWRKSQMLWCVGTIYSADDARRIAGVFALAQKPWSVLLMRGVERVDAAFGADETGRKLADAATRDMLARLDVCGAKAEAAFDALTPGSPGYLVERIISAYGGTAA
jgi:hypothetical protein